MLLHRFLLLFRLLQIYNSKTPGVDDIKQEKKVIYVTYNGFRCKTIHGIVYFEQPFSRRIPIFAFIMKRTVLLLALYILLKPAVPVIDFVFNYGYIITELCINRDKPELECNGKCYLKKELAEASQDENPISQDRKIPMPGSELFFQVPILVYPEMAPETYTSTLPISTNTNYLQQETDDIFRPPIFIS